MENIEIIINNVLNNIKGLSSEHIYNLKIGLQSELYNYDIKIKETELTIINNNSNDKILKQFIISKRIEGCKDTSLKRYYSDINKFLLNFDKSIKEISSNDIKFYLANYQLKREVSKVTLQNTLMSLSSFFNWSEDNNYILKSPCRKLKSIKQDFKIKPNFTDEEIEKIRNNCNVRNRAIIEFLLSSGCRVGEISLLNKEDINFNNNSCVVCGKGHKERTIFFSNVTKYYLKKYLNSRKDNQNGLLCLKDFHIISCL